MSNAQDTEISMTSCDITDDPSEKNDTIVVHFSNIDNIIPKQVQVKGSVLDECQPADSAMSCSSKSSSNGESYTECSKLTTDVSDSDYHSADNQTKKKECVVTMEGTGEDLIDRPITVKVTEDTVSVISSVQGDICRICHCQAEEERLINPCQCAGSLEFVHQSCLQTWVKSSDVKKCELCGYPFNMTSTVKPFRQWTKMDMSAVERRKVLCSVAFHIAAITCVIWSLYVLIDRTTEEIQQGNLNWPFWTKLVVVAIGFTGGLVFMYVQCKMYVQLFRKWKQFNRVIYINNVKSTFDASTSDCNEESNSGENKHKKKNKLCLNSGQSSPPTASWPPLSV